jgi:hypothetical protein
MRVLGEINEPIQPSQHFINALALSSMFGHHAEQGNIKIPMFVGWNLHHCWAENKPGYLQIKGIFPHMQ